MKYYLIAGEPSGDLHGANLIEGLRKADPEAQFRFWGGDRMAAAGGAANLAKHYRETSFFGIVQVLKNLRTIKRQMLECQADVAAFAPDVLILVDYPGFNMKMARWAKEHGIRTFYYIAPKVWAWREWRVKAIRKYVDRLFIIFPFERSYFPRHGIEPIFEGNPLVDAIEAKRAALPSPAQVAHLVEHLFAQLSVIIEAGAGHGVLQLLHALAGGLDGEGLFQVLHRCAVFGQLHFQFFSRDHSQYPLKNKKYRPYFS